MDMAFVRERITELRIKRGFSESELSHRSGHSRNYIHNIIAGQSQLPVSELLCIIDSLGLSPKLFFDRELIFSDSLLAEEIIEGMKDLSGEDLAAVSIMIKRLSDKK